MRKRNPSRSEPGRPGGSDTARARVSDPAHSSSAPPGTSHRSRPSDVLSCPVPLTEACHKTSEHSQARGPQSGETTHLQGSDPECGTDALRGPAPVARCAGSWRRPTQVPSWTCGPEACSSGCPVLPGNTSACAAGAATLAFHGNPGQGRFSVVIPHVLHGPFPHRVPPQLHTAGNPHVTHHPAKIRPSAHPLFLPTTTTTCPGSVSRALPSVLRFHIHETMYLAFPSDSPFSTTPWKPSTWL